VLPHVPTMAEFVPGYEASTWYGVGAPKGTSTEIIEKLNREISAVVAEPNMKARLAGLGLQPMSLTSTEFGKFIADEIRAVFDPEGSGRPGSNRKRRL
jgi:tripartite-type tricarboxylate transporter receptor subunit TctC